MKKQFFPIIIILILTAVGSVFFLLKKNNPSVNTPVQNVAREKLYKSDRYTFSFSYPGNYLLTERDTGSSSTGSLQAAERSRHTIVLTEDTPTNRAFQNGTLVGTDGSTAITVDVFQNPEHQSAQAWVEGSAYSNFKLANNTAEEVPFAGENAVHYFWDGLYRGESIVVAHDDSIIMLSVTYLESSDRIGVDFSTVIGSFAFKR